MQSSGENVNGERWRMGSRRLVTSMDSSSSSLEALVNAGCSNSATVAREEEDDDEAAGDDGQDSA